jgi:hypothetical protein
MILALIKVPILLICNTQLSAAYSLATGPVSQRQMLNLAGSTGFLYQLEVDN